MKNLFLLYGTVCYVFFLGVFTYTACFVANLIVPKTIDSGEAGAIGTAIVINVVLLSLFAIQHTIMARPAFKEWWTNIIPKPIERSTYVLCTNVILVLLFWQWRPMPEIVWEFENTALVGIMWGICGFGWLTVLYSTFLIDHFDLFGMRQVVLNYQGKEYAEKDFKVVSLYKYMRNPLMVGFMIAFWATPTMSQGHLLWAIVTTGYIFIGTIIEENDLLKLLGPEYAEYRANTPKFLPIPRGQ